MSGTQPSVAETAALIGNPPRANILMALMDGRARTASELAYAAGVSPQTTSGHLAKMTEARLLTPAKAGETLLLPASFPEDRPHARRHHGGRGRGA